MVTRCEMTDIKCPRCGYKTNLRANMRKHLQRKRLCSAILSSMTIEDIVEQQPDILNVRTCDVDQKPFVCKDCSSRFTMRSALSRHRHNTCPSRLEHQNTLIEERNDYIQLSTQLSAINDTNNHIIDENKHLKNVINDLGKKVQKLEIELQITKDDVSEKTYQTLLERFRFPGSTHMRFSCGVSDITTDTVHAEIKRYDTWKEAIGQLLSFNIASPRAEMHVYLFGKYSVSCKKIAIEHFQKLNIKPFELQIENNKLIIRDVSNNHEQKYDIDPEKL